MVVFINNPICAFNKGVDNIYREVTFAYELLKEFHKENDIAQLLVTETTPGVYRAADKYSERFF